MPSGEKCLFNQNIKMFHNSLQAITCDSTNSNYCSCVLRWLMRPIYCIEQGRSEEESSVGDALCTFLLGFADTFCFVFTNTQVSPLCSIRCNLFPQLCWYIDVFKGDFEGVLVSLLLTTMKASLRIFFGKRLSKLVH